MPTSASLSTRCRPAIALAVSAFAFWLVGCSVYDSSLLDSALAASLSSAGDGGLGGATSAGAQGIAGLGDVAGSRGLAAGGVGHGGGADDAGTGDIVAGTGGSESRAGAGGSVGSASGAGSGGTAAGSGGSAAGSGGSVSGAGAGGSAPTVVELASGKKSTASSFQTGNEIAKGNDGDLKTKWCAVDGTFPQWWRVDLGAVHSLTKFTVTWEHPDRKYTYMIETSQNDAVYALQSSVSGTGSVQSANFPPNTSARYVRITVTDGASATYMGVTYPTWASFFEFSITGT